MKLVKILLASSLLAACLQPLLVCAADSQAQALAREALQKKMQEIQPAAVDTNIATPAPVAVKKPAPAPVAPAPVVTPAQTPPPAPVVAQPAPPAPVAPAPAAVPAAAAVQQPPSPKPPSQDAAKIAKARDALHQKMNEIAATPPVQTPPENVAQVPSPLPGRPLVAPAPAKTKKVKLDFPPLPQPPSPLSSDKQQRLDDLLRRYQAEEITPEKYHAERAKLMAQQ